MLRDFQAPPRRLSQGLGPAVQNGARTQQSRRSAALRKPRSTPCERRGSHRDAAPPSCNGRSPVAIWQVRMRSRLTADCSHCVALCCVALAFDRSALFAFDKAAAERCRHLGDGVDCRIHAERNARGMSGCESYDCLGAGQRATTLFGGRPALTGAAENRSLLAAFFALRDVHQLLWLLHTCRQRWTLSSEQQRASTELETQLWAIDHSDALNGFANGQLSSEVHRLVAEVGRSATAVRPPPKVGRAPARVRLPMYPAQSDTDDHCSSKLSSSRPSSTSCSMTSAAALGTVNRRFAT